LIFQLNLLSHLHPLFAFSLFLPNHHQPHTPILNHHRPLHHQFAQICSLSCHCQRHPLLPHAVREPLKLQMTMTDQIGVKVGIFVSKVLDKGELGPCTLLEITKMSLVASMWHFPYVRSVKIDDRDKFC